MTWLTYVPKALAILRFMLELTPLIQQAETLFPQPGQGKKKKSFILGLIKKALAFLGDENIIKEDHADAGVAIVGLADSAIDGVVEVLNETGGWETEAEVGD